jgi:DNA repair exonuclease SbcCD ATPase subunit
MATYLEALGLPHSVEFTPNLNANITQFGRELSYGCLSNGQKARVNFALSLAFCDVLQKIHRKINIQIFDEVLDIGLDSHGISAASRLLKRKAREENLAVFVISHRDEISNAFDNTLIVRQTDGFSHIEITQ